MSDLPISLPLTVSPPGREGRVAAIFGNGGGGLDLPMPSVCHPTGVLPFHEFIIKIHGRCNLACDHCYIYTMADQSWSDRPRLMTRAVIEGTVGRIAEHLRQHRIRRAQVVLHGGEPLLAGRARLDLFSSTLRAQLPAGTAVDLTVQTNATLLDDDMLDLFAEHRIRVGVSLDGDRAANDLHRRRHTGRSSHPDVVRGLRLLQKADRRHLFAGLLATVDLRNNPVTTYQALLEFDPPMIDFLLPAGNWQQPPPGRTPSESHTPYADWLIAVFDRWHDSPRHEVEIRLFTELLRLLGGRPSRTDAIGVSPFVSVVVETDGDIEQVDMLKSAYQGAAGLRMNIRTNSFDDALGHPGILARQQGIDALCLTCRRCPVRSICGGGQYAHRFQPGTGFDNPSVYCPDLRALIDHASRKMIISSPAAKVG
jgi:uncharacterized protein